MYEVDPALDLSPDRPLSFQPLHIDFALKLRELGQRIYTKLAEMNYEQSVTISGIFDRTPKITDDERSSLDRVLRGRFFQGQIKLSSKDLEELQ